MSDEIKINREEDYYNFQSFLEEFNKNPEKWKEAVLNLRQLKKEIEKIKYEIEKLQIEFEEAKKRL